MTKFDKPSAVPMISPTNLAYGAACQAVQRRADGHPIDAAHVVMPMVCVMVAVDVVV